MKEEQDKKRKIGLTQETQKSSTITDIYKRTTQIKPDEAYTVIYKFRGSVYVQQGNYWNYANDDYIGHDNVSCTECFRNFYFDGTDRNSFCCSILRVCTDEEFGKMLISYTETGKDRQ